MYLKTMFISFVSYVEKKSQDVPHTYDAKTRLIMAARNVDTERGRKTVTQFLTYLKDMDPETGTRVSRRATARTQAQNIVLGPTMAEMAGGGVVRARDVSRGGARISCHGRGRGQVSRGGLICPPDMNIVARGNCTTLKVLVGPIWV